MRGTVAHWPLSDGLLSGGIQPGVSAFGGSHRLSGPSAGLSQIFNQNAFFALPTFFCYPFFLFFGFMRDDSVTVVSESVLAVLNYKEI